MVPQHLKKNAVAYTLTYIYAAGGYFIFNRYPLYPPSLLPLSPIDLYIPVMPWTTWIYITVYFMPLLGAYFVKDAKDTRNMIMAFLVTSTIGFVVFTFYPTAYMRPDLTQHQGWSFPLNVIYQIDQPTNCWPSMHVTYAFLSAFFVRRSRKGLGEFLIFWAFIVSVSTLTTKQHYLWDVLAGYILARVSFYVLERRSIRLAAVE